LSRYRGPISLAVYSLLMGLVALANLSQSTRLLAFTVTLAAGGCLAAYALHRTQFQPTRHGLY
jgi:hypothetical protein